MGYKLFEDYLKICKSDKRKEADLPKIYAIEKSYEKIKKENHPFEINMLDITGRDLIELGIPKGPRIGDTLECLLKIAIKDPDSNKKEKLIEKIDKNIIS